MSPVEHLDVLVVGAGLSGVAAGHYLQQRCPWATYAILEGRDALGGTWDLFRYPGIRSDSDMFTLGYSFRPWDGERSIADGPSIRRYIQQTAAAEGIDRHIRYRHRVVRAEWSTEQACWQVTAERTDTGETLELSCDFLFLCTGYYRYEHGHQPAFPGLDSFTGTFVHPQHWPEDLDVTGQKVVVIGSGATAITLVPALAATAGHVTMLQRSPTYITSLPACDPVANLLRRMLPPRLSGPAVRWYKALTTQGFFQLSRRKPDLVKKLLRRGIQRQLPAGYDIATHFTPRYDPWDQRLCVVPDGDLFRAIRSGTASVVTDHIDSFTPTGIRLRSGAELPADVVVSATGLDVVFLGGIGLVVDAEPVDIAQRLTYKGMMLEGVPNLALAIGYTNASWTLRCELTCRYVCRLLDHLHRSGLRQCTPVNRDPTVVARPVLDLTSGYVQRALDRSPKQGSAFPWQVHQSYLRDYRAMERSSIHDGAMVFSNPRRSDRGEQLTAVGS
jgi:cation diffusion facilitator CzcD-associated flavoprotein CzcO